ncbi:hypothetical protein [Micromonospora sp. NPDC049204]|uniref:hypothetical protein n=1 Tax=Micromonospora sp. NPDC049204 TaxID=3154351 RepID=UPI00340E8909
MSDNAEAIARRLADMDRRLTAVERGSQMSRTSIEAGTLVVNDPAGTPVLTVGRQDDGGYAVAGTNGGQVIATGVSQEVLDQIAADLELADGQVTEAKIAAGAVTETKIADDAITTPKIVAGAVQALQIAAEAISTGKLVAAAVTADKIASNSVTADKITANAIDGRTITGSILAGGEVITAATDGSYVRITTTPEDGAVVEVNPPLLPDPVAHPVTPGSIKTGIVDVSEGVPDNTVRTAYVGPSVNGQNAAEMYMTGHPEGSDLYIKADRFFLEAADGASWSVDGDWEIARPVESGHEIHFQVRSDGLVVAQAVEVSESAQVYGDLAVNGGLTVGGDASFAAGALQTETLKGRSSTDVTPTSGSLVDIPGTAQTITTTRDGARYLAIWTLDAELVTAGTATTIYGKCVVNGSALTDNVLAGFANAAAVGARATVTQHAAGVLGDAGSYTFKSQVARAFGTASVRCNATHSGLTVLIFE